MEKLFLQGLWATQESKGHDQALSAEAILETKSTIQELFESQAYKSITVIGDDANIKQVIPSIVSIYNYESITEDFPCVPADVILLNNILGIFSNFKIETFLKIIERMGAKKVLILERVYRKTLEYNLELPPLGLGNRLKIRSGVFINKNPFHRPAELILELPTPNPKYVDLLYSWTPQTPTPFVLFVGKNLDHTFNTLKIIREIRPKTLIVIAEDQTLRQNIVSQINWNCALQFRIKNKESLVGEELSWVFQQVESAIIIPVDCVPHADFFRFCDLMLHRYEGDSRTGMITGNNVSGKSSAPYSYRFSRIPTLLGWATWRSSWLMFEEYMNEWPRRINDIHDLKKMLDKNNSQCFYKKFFRVMDSADYNGDWENYWFYCVLLNHWLVVTPSQNLVEYRGSGKKIQFKGEFSSLEFPLVHPPGFVSWPAYEDQVLIKLKRAGLLPKIPGEFRLPEIRLTAKLGVFGRMERSIRKRL